MPEVKNRLSRCGHRNSNTNKNETHKKKFQQEHPCGFVVLLFVLLAVMVGGGWLFLRLAVVLVVWALPSLSYVSRILVSQDVC